MTPLIWSVVGVADVITCGRIYIPKQEVRDRDRGLTVSSEDMSPMTQPPRRPHLPKVSPLPNSATLRTKPFILLGRCSKHSSEIERQVDLPVKWHGGPISTQRGFTSILVTTTLNQEDTFPAKHN
jgi:hypothetical protein